jgi:hypothetical protein
MACAFEFETEDPPFPDWGTRIALGLLPADVNEGERCARSVYEEALAVHVCMPVLLDPRPADSGVSAERRFERGRAREEERQGVCPLVDEVDRDAVNMAPGSLTARTGASGISPPLTRRQS